MLSYKAWKIVFLHSAPVGIMPSIGKGGGGEVRIKIGTTQCQQYDFLGWPHVIGRNCLF